MLTMQGQLMTVGPLLRIVVFLEEIYQLAGEKAVYQAHSNTEGQFFSSCKFFTLYRKFSTLVVVT
jgi:hypothetical protein